MSIWCRFDVKLMSNWCLFDVKLMSIWCQIDVNLISNRYQFDINLTSNRHQIDIYNSHTSDVNIRSNSGEGSDVTSIFSLTFDVKMTSSITSVATSKWCQNDINVTSNWCVMFVKFRSNNWWRQLFSLTFDVKIDVKIDQRFHHQNDVNVLMSRWRHL